MEMIHMTRKRSSTEKIKKRGAVDALIQLHFVTSQANAFKHKDGHYTGSMNQRNERHGHGTWQSTENEDE